MKKMTKMTKMKKIGFYRIQIFSIIDKESMEQNRETLSTEIGTLDVILG